MNRTITIRYARALFTLSSANGVVERIESDLELLDGALKASKELMALLRHPRISGEQKKTLLDKAVAAQFHPVLRDFLHLVVDKKREDALAFLLEDYRTVADRARGIVKARVQSVYQLPQPKLERLKGELERVLKSRVVVENELNPELLGGISIFIGNRVIDASVRYRLKVLRERLLEAEVG